MTIDRNEVIRQLTAAGKPFEFCDIELHGKQVRVLKNGPRTLRALYEEARCDETFLVYADDRLSYEQAWQQACRIAHALVNDYGITKGDRVAIAMRNYPEWVTAFMAITSIGGIAVLLNAHWKAPEIEYAIDNSEPRVIFADQERIERLSQCTKLPTGLAIIAARSTSLPSQARHFADVIDRYETVEMSAVELDPADDAAIFYTSGSTGHPKGAVSCHLNIVSAPLGWELEGEIAMRTTGFEPQAEEAQPATLLAVPLFHVGGCQATLLSSYRVHRKVVLMYKWDPHRALDLIEEERISFVNATPPMTGDLVLAARESSHALRSLRAVGGGGAPMPREQVGRIDTAFASAIAHTGWGMTETNAIGTTISGPAYVDHPTTCGWPVALLDFRIVDNNGEVLPTNARGELQVRGAAIFRGYWKRPDADAEAFVDDWLRTGDVAYIDDENLVYIVDRIKDLVLRGGENIGCGAVEDELMAYPDIIEASVYGVPDERLGEELGATIYSTVNIDEAELHEFLSERLANFEIPRYLHFISEPLPRGETGKILKRQLRDEAAVRQGTA